MKSILFAIVGLFIVNSSFAADLVECKARRFGNNLDLQFCYDFDQKEVVGCSAQEGPKALYKYRETLISGEQTSLMTVAMSETQSDGANLMISMTDSEEVADRLEVINVTLRDSGSDRVEILRRFGGDLIFRRANCRW
ncbi:MAG: hypothetical protein AAF203_05450 [Pseudomonadota bacterium]